MKNKLLYLMFITWCAITTMYAMEQLEVPCITLQQKFDEYDEELAKIGVWQAQDESEEFEKEVDDLVILTKITFALGIMKDTVNLSVQEQQRVDTIMKKLEYCKKNGSLEKIKLKNDDYKRGDSKKVKFLKEPQQSSPNEKKCCLVC
jgi:hypothetical protein